MSTRPFKQRPLSSPNGFHPQSEAYISLQNADTSSEHRKLGVREGQEDASGLYVVDLAENDDTAFNVGELSDMEHNSGIVEDLPGSKVLRDALEKGQGPFEICKESATNDRSRVFGKGED